MSAEYRDFAKGLRATLKEDHPDKTKKEINGMIKAQWKAAQPKKKRAPSAYSLFTKAVYGETEGANFREKAQAIAVRWGQLTEEEKRPYLAEAAGARAEDAEIVKKRPPSAYSYFTKAMFAEVEGASFKEKTMAIAAKWKAMTPEEKQPYYDLVHE